MWKAPGLWLCVQKAKELWFRGIFNLHSDLNKGLAVALRAVVQSDWGSGGCWGEWRGGDGQDHRPYLFPLFTLACLYSHWRAAFPLYNPLLLLPLLLFCLPRLPQSCKCMTREINWMGRGRAGSAETSNTSLSCLVTFIYHGPSYVTAVCVCPPLAFFCF